MERTLRILRLLPLLLLPVPVLLLPVPVLLPLEGEAQHPPRHRLLQPGAQHRRPRPRQRVDAEPEVNVEAAASEAALHCPQTAFR